MFRFCASVRWVTFAGAVALTGMWGTAEAQMAVAEPPVLDAPAAAEQVPLEERLDAIFDRPEWDSAHWGVLVHNLTTSEVLYERNPGKVVMPASNMKLFTSAAGLVTFGADHRFETKIFASGTTDSQGVLRGNIYVLASGDPAISGRYFDTPTTAILQQWADAVTSAGIWRVEGDVVGDDDIFDDSYMSGSWAPSYLQEWYAAENSGLAINDNCWDAIFEVTTSPVGDNGERLNPLDSDEDSTQPLYLKVTNLLDTNYVTIYPNGLRVGDRTNIRLERNDCGSAAQTAVGLSGTIRMGEKVREWGSLRNGTGFAVTLLKEALERNNVTVTGDAVDIDDYTEEKARAVKENRGQLVYTHVSPPLHEILAVINKPSQNFYADMVLKAVGAEVHNEGSWNAGQRVMEDILTTAGARIASFNMSDGSGLSRFNFVEPQQVVALLTFMRGRPDFPIYEASLPVMGLDGTLRGRMRGTPAEGNVKAKTGTIGRVRALSGYLKTDAGHDLVFSMIANNFHVPTSAATAAQDEALMELIRHQ